MMQRFFGCLTLEPKLLTLVFRYTVDLKKKWDFTYIFLMASQLLLN